MNQPQPLPPTILPSQDNKSKLCPRWNVILIDDPDHTFQYVIELLIKVFNKNMHEAEALTEEVHRMGRAIAVTCTKERAELYVEQVGKFGSDGYIFMTKNKQSGPLRCEMEPAE